MQKTDHTQFMSFVLSELDQITSSKKERSKAYFLWVGFFLTPIIVLSIGVIQGGEWDRKITSLLYDRFSTSSFMTRLASILQYSYLVFLIGTLVCLILTIFYLIPKTRAKLEVSGKYAIFYLLVLGFSLLDHLTLQILVNRISFDPLFSSIDPYYSIDPSFSGFWNSSFPNNNLIISGIIMIFPVLFGNRGKAFKWILGILSGSLILVIGLSEILVSQAWFTDLFASIGIVQFWSWFFYWHILYIKDTEWTKTQHKLTDLYNQGYNELIKAQKSFYNNNLTKCEEYLTSAKKLFNQSISSLQNMSANTSGYIQRNEFWKFNVNQLLKETKKSTPSSKKWLYIF